MKKDILIIGLIILVATGIVLALVFLESGDRDSGLISMFKSEEEKSRIIREPAVAGSFYPATNQEIKELINQFLGQVALKEVGGFLKVLIVPHAGYVFSGQTAVYGYQALAENFSKERINLKTVILIGSSHRYPVKGVAIDESTEWETPLGRVEVDQDLAQFLVKQNPLFEIDSSPHQQEHSLEVQIPFLQSLFSGFKILPLLVNELDANELESVSQTLAEQLGEEVIIIASTDFSHYPAYEQAQYADQKVIAAILTGQINELKKTIADLEREQIPQAATFICAQPAVEVAMKIAEKIEAQEIKLLNYSNSGDAPAGDKSQVVGYAAIAFSSQRRGGELNQKEQEQLLAVARQAVESYVKTGMSPNLTDFKSDSFFLNKKQGAFVTLKKHGLLRGCIGSFEVKIPLYQVVSQMAIAAATEDKRFQPVTVDELGDLEYEISVLSSLKKIEDWQEIEIGRHGVQMRMGLRGGTFLPQVAIENNWNQERFLSELCVGKAGLTSNCYKQEGVELYIFTAQVF